MSRQVDNYLPTHKMRKRRKRMSVIKGDFLGFTFDGVHSTELGIFRVSDGERYSENLLPVIQDKTVQIPGADGTYYYGSYYTQRQFNISIAFDGLTESQLRRLKTLFSDKKIHSLIFDELPYKVYKVKIAGTPNLKYVCFEAPSQTDIRDRELNNGIKSKEALYGVGARTTSGRVYKGEGQLNFISYNPFAKSRFKYLDEYVIKNIPEWGSMDTADATDVYYNLYDWVDSSRMVHSGTQKKDPAGELRRVDEVVETGVMYYNAGDLYTPFTLSILLKTGKFSGGTFGEEKDYMTLMLERFKELNPTENTSYIDSYIKDLNELRNHKLLNQEKSSMWIASWGIFSNDPTEPDFGDYTGYIGTWLRKFVDEEDINEHHYVDRNAWKPETLTGTAKKVSPNHITLPGFDLQPGDSGFRINSKLHLIEGINSTGQATGNIYNKYITDGDFFELEPTEGLTWLPIELDNTNDFQKGLISYSYLYF